MSREIEELRKQYRDLIFEENRLLEEEEKLERKLRNLKRDYQFYLKELERLMESLKSRICQAQERFNL